MQLLAGPIMDLFMGFTALLLSQPALKLSGTIWSLFRLVFIHSERICVRRWQRSMLQLNQLQLAGRCYMCLCRRLPIPTSFSNVFGSYAINLCMQKRWRMILTRIYTLLH
ncbi:hypothetical protein ABB27_06755 [Stenotrophomonas terrae]|uniref:Uncharacterized protein n=1 Tax=Stenotrophomonas terrae TaxID=405446 RepID=A0A0R0CHA8_9GAMM|nr:hypothetical protein ABB27_06755 [Stenotrophomonas terrae]